MEEIHIQCPYCLQSVTILLDLGVSEYTSVIDDCEVCCRPIEISYNVENRTISSYSYSAIDGNEY